MAGGVNSNFRLGISPTPLVFERGEGPYLYDVDGNRLIDYYLGMGPMILGHRPQALVRRRRRSKSTRASCSPARPRSRPRRRGSSARWCRAPERMRFGCSGSEVDQAALRLARAATGRKKIVKFEGHYHGWFDNVLWSTAPALDAAGPAECADPVAGSMGQLAETARRRSWSCPGTTSSSLEERLAQGDVAGVIMEAAMCNTGAIHPGAGYLEGVREACTRHGTILIFDEVITGFRVAPGGAQERFGVTPDLATFGKAIANGFPVAAIAGRADLMDLFATGGVVHGGTYNAQPVAMAATAATLKSLTPALYATIDVRGTRLMEGMRDIFAVPASSPRSPASRRSSTSRSASTSPRATTAISLG